MLWGHQTCEVADFQRLFRRPGAEAAAGKTAVPLLDIAEALC